jgi:hypothetical protein
MMKDKTVNASQLFFNIEEWLDASFDLEENEIIFGTTKQAIIRPFTKNLIEAPEKAFKTTFMLRAMIGLALGKTFFPKLPVLRSRKVLYVHGELSPPEIQERTIASVQDLPRPLNGNFIQGRDLHIHLIEGGGQRILKNLVKTMQPDDLVLDPWQGFIPGFDENEFKDISRATHFMDQLIEELKVTIYLVTHTGKDHSRGTRGHSSLAGWRDTLIRLDRKKNIIEIKVDPRWAAPFEFNVEFKDGTLWATDKDQFSPQTSKVYKFLKESQGRATRQEIGAYLQLDKTALRMALSRASTEGAIVLDGGLVYLPGEWEPNIIDLLLKG